MMSLSALSICVNILSIGIVLVAGLDTRYKVIEKEPELVENVSSGKLDYTPDWESLDKRPLPEWYDEAKVGIFIHWGVYSVPSYGSEWFWWNWKGEKNDGYIEYMNKNYKPEFTYQDFARDFTVELFDPNEWANIFNQSGAKYVVLTSKHHDGYALWPSLYSFGWNSKDVGAHRDLVDELQNAIKHNTSLRFGLYHSLYEWFNPLWNNDKQLNFTTQEFVDKKILPEMIELVKRYNPEVIWSDGEWDAPDTYWKSTEFIAWLYNESPVKKTVVTNDRWGKGTLCKHGDFYTCTDRYNPGVLQTHKWENCFTLDRKSWGHRGNAKFEDYLTPQEVINELVTTISCGGNVLVNVGPTNVGTLDPIFIERLLQMGRWLKANGNAIYGSIPWTHQNDSLAGTTWYTASKKMNRIDQILTQDVYAIVLDYPYGTNTIELKDVAAVFNEEIPVQLLGYPDKIQWKRTGNSLILEFPPKNLVDLYSLRLAWTFKINTILKKNSKY